MKLAPIVLFVYNRPWHTQQTVEALAKNPLADQSDLIIFSDGPKNELAVEKVEKVRAYIRSIKGFGSVRIIESTVNKGLANSIISGVTDVLTKHETIIVLEDDMVTSPNFLFYMNRSLELYRNDNEVVSIHGYMYPVDGPLPDTFFLKGAECWGWATWRRGWAVFEHNPWKLLRKIILQGRRYEFDIDDGYPYTRMLLRQCLGTLDSWAIRWYASAFLEKKLTLYPAQSMIENIGLDDSGTHNKSWSKHVFETAAFKGEMPRIDKIPRVESTVARKALSAYFKRTRVPLIKKIFYLMGDMLKRKE